MDQKKTMLLEEKIVAILMIVMVLMVAAQVLSRYVFHKSLSHTEEIVRYCFVWASFLGIAAPAFRKKHLTLAFAPSLFPEKIVRIAHYAGWLGAVIFSGVIIYYGIKVVVLQIRTGQTTAAMGLPMWIIGLALPICALVLVVRLGVMMRKHVRKEA